jgi:ketosteroid isomerase-like protein
MVTFVPLFVARSVAAWWAPVWPEVLANPTRSNLLRVKEERTKVAGPEPRATLADVADQIDYVRKVAGVDHVGIGGDFPATAGAPDGLENVSKYPELFAELIRRGWTDDALVKLAGGNLLRVMRTAEDAARKLRTERPASIATLESKADEVLKLEDLWATARVKRDVKTLDGLLAPDFVSTENNRTMDRATTVRELTSGAETIEAAGNEEMTLHDFGAMAAVTGWLAVRGHGSSGSFARRYRYTDSWVRTPSGWRLAIAHYDLVPEGR